MLIYVDTFNYTWYDLDVEQMLRKFNDEEVQL